MRSLVGTILAPLDSRLSHTASIAESVQASTKSAASQSRASSRAFKISSSRREKLFSSSQNEARRSSVPIKADFLTKGSDTTPIQDGLRKLQPLEFEPVRRTEKEPLWNSLLEEHHYLGYEQPVGEHLKYLVWGQGRPVACLAWSSAPRHLRSRDRYIGWNAEARRRNLRFIAYNTRFLILPWVKVEHLASHILGRMASRISADWQRIYGHPIYFPETFVDPERFRGTCYRAANWVVLGKTTGRGKQSNSYVPNRSIKEVLGYPLAKQFRELLLGPG